MVNSPFPHQQFNSLQQTAYQMSLCTEQLFVQIEQQQALTGIIDRIRSSLELDIIFKTTTTEIRQLLNADRVGVFCFTPGSGWNEGEFVSEDVASGFSSVIATKISDHCFGSQFAAAYIQGQVQAVADIYNEGLSDCHIQILEQFQVRANLVIPILKGDDLWGLLCIHQCDRPRRWQLTEIEFIRKIAVHFAIALQQAEYLDRLQNKAMLLAQAQAQNKSIIRQQALVKITTRIRQSFDFAAICETATEETRHLLEADRVVIYRFNPDWSGEFAFESADSQWISLIEQQRNNLVVAKNVSECSLKLLGTAGITDTHLQETQGGIFAQGVKVFRVCPDIQNAGFSDCYVEVLESYQARSYLITAIYVEHKLWGLLAAFQNSAPREWYEDDIQLLVHIAEQLGIALQQAEYVRTIEFQSLELQQILEELQQSQMQMIQNEKMAGLGQLVAGVAHEINNPVNFIYGNLSYVNEYVTDLMSLFKFYQQHNSASTEEIEKFQKQSEAIDIDFILTDLPKILSSMELGAERIRQIVLSLRNFSRLDEAEYKAVDIHEGIDSTLLILGSRIKSCGGQHEVQIIKNYGNIPYVECYPAQLNQVFMNLLVNALDAIEESINQEKLTIYNSVIRKKFMIWISTNLTEQEQIEIHIRDNGIGMKENTISKIFDHFFTTKEVGKGTGLGLAISKKIIMEKHGGTLNLNSTPGEGTEFIVSLPIKLQSSMKETGN
jgi:two-component system, NtrC family, sensor kinase